MIHKKFSQQLFDQNDVAARTAITGFLTRQGLIVQPNDNKYGVDLYVLKFTHTEDSTKYTKLYAVECEIKRVWSGPTLPWGSIQLPQRKLKYAQQEAVPVEYWILNNELTHAIVIYEAELTDACLVEVRNKYVDRGEYFYQVPLDVCSIVELESGK